MCLIKKAILTIIWWYTLQKNISNVNKCKKQVIYMGATIQKQRILFQANILLILWNRHLFYAFTTFVWVINQFRKVHLLDRFPLSPNPQNRQNWTHWFHLFSFVLCAFSNVSWNGLSERMHTCIGCICLAFHHCVFSNGPSKCLHVKIYNHTNRICVTFPHCAFSNVSSNCLSVRIYSHIGCICLTFLHCGLSNVTSNCLHVRL